MVASHGGRLERCQVADTDAIGDGGDWRWPRAMTSASKPMPAAAAAAAMRNTTDSERTCWRAPAPRAARAVADLIYTAIGRPAANSTMLGKVASP